MDTTQRLLEERRKQYGPAWKLTGLAIQPMREQYNRFCEEAPEYELSWIIILCKLIRALATPRYADHWRDIAGYATLVADDIEKGGTDGLLAATGKREGDGEGLQGRPDDVGFRHRGRGG